MISGVSASEPVSMWFWMPIAKIWVPSHNRLHDREAETSSIAENLRRPNRIIEFISRRLTSR